MPSANGHGAKPERIALYLRVSSEEQREAGTIQTQRAELERHAAAHGFDVFDVYDDDGVSGTIPLHERPAGARLLEDAKRDAFESVLVYRLDRLARTQLAILDAADRLERVGVALRSATEHYETATPAGRLMFQMLGSFAEFERESIRQRTRDGLYRAHRAGKKTGALPYGYTVDEGGMLAIMPEEAVIVRQVFENIARGGSTLYAEAKRLNALGVPTPGLRYSSGPAKKPKATGWREAVLHDLVHRRTYEGVAEVRLATGEIVEQEVPAIVSAETRRRALEQLRENQCYSGGRPHRFYLLRGLVKCAVCGSGCTGRTKSAYGRRYVYYRCRDDHTSRGLRAERGHAPGVPAEWLEATIWEDVRSFLRNPGETLRRVREQMQTDTPIEVEERRADLARRLADKRAERERWLRLYTRGAIDEVELDTHLHTLRSEMDALELLLQGVEDEVARQQEHAQIARDTAVSLERLATRLSELEEDDSETALEKRRKLVQLLVCRIEVGRDEDGRIHIRTIYRFADPSVTGVRNPSRPRGAEAPLPPAVGSGLEHLHLGERDLLGPHQDELGYPHAHLDAEGLLAVVVDEGDHDLPAVPRVYETRGVDRRDPVARREPAAR
jgi:site-specific DNA recombinase